MKDTRNTETLSYTLSDDAGTRCLFLVAHPDRELLRKQPDASPEALVDRYSKQTDSLLAQAGPILQEMELQNNVVSINVFLADIGMKQLVRLKLRQFFGLDVVPTRTPVTTYIPQRPGDGSLVAIKLYAIGGPAVRLGLAYREESITFESHDIKWCHIGDIIPNEEPIGAYERSLWAFQRLERVLESRNMGVENLLRTWIYQGNLVYDEGGEQRYKELNRARTTFFEGRQFLQQTLVPGYKGVVYPASTGIGADDMDVTLGAIAFSTGRDDVLTVPLENPRQTSAFDYGAVYGPQSPKFARAMAIAYDDLCHILVSGTASITDSETRHPGDVAAQTHQTLDNIAALISPDNLKASGLDGYGASLPDANTFRVYIKRPDDYETVREICLNRIAKVPAVFVIADVCRPDLLVEIEGTATVTRKSRSAEDAAETS